MTASSALPIQRIHHVQLWAGNAKQAAFFYRKAFGFSQLAYSGPETGDRQVASYVLEQGKIRLTICTPLSPEHPMTGWLAQHGDGVHDIAMATDDVDFCYAEALKRGAESAHAPKTVEDAHGSVRMAAVKTFGQTIHTFVDDRNYRGVFLPGYRVARVEGVSTGLTMVDHIVGNVEDGRMLKWVEFYEQVFGFSRFVSFDDKDISTEFSSLRSQVMASPTKLIKFPINEPAPGKRKSQIQEYVEFNQGPGVQHLALLTNDIVTTITQLRANGVEFLGVPDTYYEEVWSRVGGIDEAPEDIRRLRILVDRDEEGYLLQLFTKPLEDRPTLFFEIIQRKGAQGFGKGNFRALFESIEREQAARGNL